MLARREHARLELQQKLQPRVVNPSILEEVLDQLAQEGLQSDARFCEAFVRYRAQRGVGPVRIRAELKARGVQEALIQHYLADQEAHSAQQLIELIDKKWGGNFPQDAKGRAKCQRFLLQRGYSYDQIRHALGQDDS